MTDDADEPRHPDKPIRRDHFENDGAARGTARMEAFADGVFAIAFTIPVIEIEMPHGGADLGGELLRLWPSYLGYVLASVVIGLYWTLHHFTGAIYRTTGHYLNLATVLFLAMIGFIAFPLRVFAEHVAKPDQVADAAEYLTVALALTGLSWLLKWTIGRRTGHVDARLDPAYVRRMTRVFTISAVLLIVAAGLVFAHWPSGLGLAAIVTLYFFRPPKTPVYVTEAPVVEGEEGM